MAKAKNTVAQDVEKSVAQDVEKSVAQDVEKAGRALVDLPAYAMTSGEYGSLPAEVADALEACGMFDTKAEK